MCYSYDDRRIQKKEEIPRTPHWKYQKPENATFFVPLLFLARGQFIIFEAEQTLQDIQEQSEPVLNNVRIIE